MGFTYSHVSAHSLCLRCTSDLFEVDTPAHRNDLGGRLCGDGQVIINRDINRVFPPSSFSLRIFSFDVQHIAFFLNDNLYPGRILLGPGNSGGLGNLEGIDLDFIPIPGSDLYVA